MSIIRKDMKYRIDKKKLASLSMLCRMKNKKKKYSFVHKLQRFLSENTDDQIVIDFCNEYQIEIPSKKLEVDNFELVLRYISRQDLELIKLHYHIFKRVFRTPLQRKEYNSLKETLYRRVTPEIFEYFRNDELTRDVMHQFLPIDSENRIILAEFIAFLIYGNEPMVKYLKDKRHDVLTQERIEDFLLTRDDKGVFLLKACRNIILRLGISDAFKEKMIDYFLENFEIEAYIDFIGSQA
jgi:hypothetical protein